MRKVLTLCMLVAAAGCASKKAALQPTTELDLRAPAAAPASPARPTPALVAEAVADQPNPIVGDERPAELPPLVFPTVGFEFDSDVLTTEGRDALDTFAASWRARGEHRRLEIGGHADSRGPEEYNLVLGQRRAGVVRKYLERLGISDDAMKAISYGENRPIDSAEGDAAFAKNRRAEVTPY